MLRLVGLEAIRKLDLVGPAGDRKLKVLDDGPVDFLVMFAVGVGVEGLDEFTR